MKLKLLFILLLTSSLLKAQEADSSSITLGLNMGIYPGGVLGIDLKYLRPKGPSILFAANYYNYTTQSPNFQNKISNALTISGLSIKPGLSILQHQTKNSILYLGLQGVITYNNSKLDINYNDAFGKHTTTYQDNHLTVGAEVTTSIIMKLSRRFYIETGIKTGLKPKTVILQNPEIANYNSYYNYAPSQGFGLSAFYLNALFGMGFKIN